MSTRDLLTVRGISSGARSVQFLAYCSESELQSEVRKLCTQYKPRRLQSQRYALVREESKAVFVFEDIKAVKDDEIILILSSDGPIEARGIKTGKNSVVILGQMSAESIKLVAEMYDIEFDPPAGEKGVYYYYY